LRFIEKKNGGGTKKSVSFLFRKQKTENRERNFTNLLFREFKETFLLCKKRFACFTGNIGYAERFACFTGTSFDDSTRSKGGGFFGRCRSLRMTALFEFVEILTNFFHCKTGDSSVGTASLRETAFVWRLQREHSHNTNLNLQKGISKN